MKSFTSTWIIGLLSSFLLVACIEPLEFDQGTGTPYILIDGVISNSPGERSVRVLRGNGLDSKTFEPVDVRGSIYRDGQFWEELAVGQPGELIVPFTLKLEEGRAYFLEIRTPEAEVFRSKAQVVQPKLHMDSLSFGIASRLAGETFTGLPKYERFVDIFANVNLPGPDEIRYYRWQVDGTFSFQEPVRPNQPQNTPTTCYISHQISDNPTTVLSSEGLASGRGKKLVSSRLIDETFLFRHVINVYMHAIDKESFDYWDRALRLTQGASTLFDEVPAPLKGNVEKIAGDPELILGQIDFSLVDTMRISLNKGTLKVAISNVCETINPCPERPVPPAGPVNPLYCKCWDCELALNNASVFPPFFWDE